jgi:hypothetical protein
MEVAYPHLSSLAPPSPSPSLLILVDCKVIVLTHVQSVTGTELLVVTGPGAAFGVGDGQGVLRSWLYVGYLRVTYFFVL